MGVIANTDLEHPARLNSCLLTPVCCSTGFGSDVENADTLRSSLRSLIVLHNQCDMALYEAAEAQFARQLRVLDSSLF